MNVNENRIKRLTKALGEKNKKKAMMTLPWRHMLSSSLTNSLRLIKKQTEDFVCITTDQDDKEFVTMPYSLYLTLLQSHKIAESLQEEQ
mgnify:FL=1|tara:strand:- start:392 stop:658 length:267 start_codon:yes stop_codon:yes gene_type:complete